MPDWVGILLLVVLLLGNAFFVGAEFAVMSARRSQIEPKAEAGSRAAATALWAMEHATLMLATTQLGITVCSLLILNVSEPAIHHAMEVPLRLTGLSDDGIAAVAFVLALALVTFLHVVFGEMVPKNLSFSVPDRAVLFLAPPLVGIARLLKPIVVALNAASNGIVRLLGVRPVGQAVSTFTLDEVATIVHQSTREGVITDRTGALSNAFEFSAKKVRDVSLGLDTLVCLSETSTPSDLERAVAKHGFSRYVILRETGEPIGYVHLKDVLDLEGEGYDRPIPGGRIRPFVPLEPDADVEDALAVMRSSGGHVGCTAGPEGETLGVVFLEDIIEELVGEVQDATRRA